MMQVKKLQLGILFCIVINLYKKFQSMCPHLHNNGKSIYELLKIYIMQSNPEYKQFQALIQHAQQLQ